MSEHELLPPHLLTAIDSPVRETRLTGVDQLTGLANGADLALAGAARAALQHLTEDDSRGVAAAATAALQRAAVRVNPDRVDFGQVRPGIRLIAEVLVEGPPIALASATVAVSGPGLRAALSGHRLRIAWQPQSDWLDGLVTVRGPAGWADVRVTGQASVGGGTIYRSGAEPAAVPRVAYDEPAEPEPAVGRRRAGPKVILASVTGLLLLGGGGAAIAMTSDKHPVKTQVAAAPETPPTPSASDPAPAPAPSIVRIPLAAEIVSSAVPSVVGTIKVGSEPEGMAVSPDSRFLYVANQHSHALSVVDTRTRKGVAIALRNTPRFVAVSRDGRLVFVSMYEDDKSGSGVAVVDTRARTVIRYLPTGVQPYTLAVGPDGRVWVPIHSKRTVEIYSADDQAPAGKILVPPNPHAVGFAPALHRAFTPDHESNVVSVIDTQTNKLLQSVAVSQAPHSLAVSPDGKTVMVAGYEANAVDLIDTATLRRTGPFPVGVQPQSVAYSADGKHAYVVNEGGNTLSVLDGQTGEATATVRVGRSPRTVAVAPDGRLAYVSNGTDNTITVLRVGQ